MKIEQNRFTVSVSSIHRPLIRFRLCRLAQNRTYSNIFFCKIFVRDDLIVDLIVL